MLYLDRVCLGEIVKNAGLQKEFGASKESIGQVLGAFFLFLALFQVPAGWLSDRYGTRITLTIHILAWSVLTGVTGFIQLPRLLSRMRGSRFQADG
jgi:MFS family permease